MSINIGPDHVKYVWRNVCVINILKYNLPYTRINFSTFPLTVRHMYILYVHPVHSNKLQFMCTNNRLFIGFLFFNFSH